MMLSVKRFFKKNCFSQKLDCPVAFGYKCAWLAFPTEQTAEVVKAVEFKQMSKANWQTGIDAAYGYESKIAFVTPPVQGWTFVVGTILSHFFCVYDKDSIEVFLKQKITAILEWE
ncbi:hypothetical protein AGMMS50296_9050 [Alphaproteobacteria bacterium]|nr:hypothetical protein AGMMS50296_9050 [Alphaproteobacteria bacterium]